MVLTAVFKEFQDGYSAFIEELPGANTQGKTINEARHNLVEAVELILESNISFWNHGVIHRYHEENDVHTYHIHEVYYDENGSDEGW